MIKFFIYIVGLRRSSGMKAGKFLWSDKHQKFIYEGRELELDEFNTLMAEQWPLQRLANQQVSGFAYVEQESVAEPIVETPDEPVVETPAEDPVNPIDSPADDDDETASIPRNTRKSRKPKN
jgi:hypothetical protein